jgi:hypothetical protein
VDDDSRLDLGRQTAESKQDGDIIH